ncbi:maleylacetoacetate isomerase [Bradyrhizobium sp. NP1]|uniref:maleylacetoacetate isomerase n=1 Tax=Bradyrhizobium sp. NP1 TaxID=3049772 RepID=UPI0025A68C73|nr:maleylacetoacetate isomerase [Bradyrhizobium sp. NP1]WJR77725.1 maleylacetoacetate isomerase [Bradyrhizobium sp. NP1]
MKFFSFWRSQASFRVRIALNLKNLPTEVIFVDLDADAQHADEFRRINPQMALPALVEDDGTVLFQSLAIIEYLEEKYPDSPLLPADIKGRARVRGLALIVACEGHPLLVPRVRRYLDRELNLRDEQQTAWRRHWVIETLTALEGHLADNKDTGRFCHGDAPTLADICMVGHAAVAGMLEMDLKRWPTVKRIYETAMALPAFASAHPLVQPDTPEAMRVRPPG